VADQIVPGPCPESGCPAPTEIDCIQVNKVYDFCFEADTNSNVCTRIPEECCELVTPTSTATGTVSSVSCSVVGTTAILDAMGNPTGFADVTLMVTVTVDYTITASNGTVLCTFSGNFSFMKTIVLCAPAGTTVSCSVPSTSVSPVAILHHQVCSTVTICLLVSSVAMVNLLVPSYGFCTPAPCVVSPQPPFSCPPSPLFPTACTVAPTVV
jgi:hypothetical protein